VYINSLIIYFKFIIENFNIIDLFYIYKKIKIEIKITKVAAVSPARSEPGPFVSILYDGCL